MEVHDKLLELSWWDLVLEIDILFLFVLELAGNLILAQSTFLTALSNFLCSEPGVIAEEQLDPRTVCFQEQTAETQ